MVSESHCFPPREQQRQPLIHQLLLHNCDGSHTPFLQQNQIVNNETLLNRQVFPFLCKNIKESHSSENSKELLYHERPRRSIVEDVRVNWLALDIVAKRTHFPDLQEIIRPNY